MQILSAALDGMDEVDFKKLIERLPEIVRNLENLHGDVDMQVRDLRDQVSDLRDQVRDLDSKVG